MREFKPILSINLTMICYGIHLRKLHKHKKKFKINKKHMTKCLEISSLSHNTQRKSFSQNDKKKSRVEAFKKLRISNWKCCDKESREFGNVTIFTNFPSLLKKVFLLLVAYSFTSLHHVTSTVITSFNFHLALFFRNFIFLPRIEVTNSPHFCLFIFRFLSPLFLNISCSSLKGMKCSKIIF